MFPYCSINKLLSFVLWEKLLDNTYYLSSQLIFITFVAKIVIQLKKLKIGYLEFQCEDILKKKNQIQSQGAAPLACGQPLMPPSPFFMVSNPDDY